jgi:hypothetical protein
MYRCMICKAVARLPISRCVCTRIRVAIAHLQVRLHQDSCRALTQRVTIDDQPRQVESLVVVVLGQRGSREAFRGIDVICTQPILLAHHPVVVPTR